MGNTEWEMQDCFSAMQMETWRMGAFLMENIIKVQQQYGQKENLSARDGKAQGAPQQRFEGWSQWVSTFMSY